MMRYKTTENVGDRTFGHGMAPNNDAENIPRDSPLAQDKSGQDELFGNNARNNDLSLTQQQNFWNDWNTNAREKSVGEVSRDQAQIIIRWLQHLGRRDLRILDVGCGTGWFCSQLTEYGDVTGTDLADEVVTRARTRLPEVTFITGDFMEIDLPPAHYDVVVTLEVFSHVPDQAEFLRRIDKLLKPGGYLMLATQNRFVLERNSDVQPQGRGQIRRWVNRRELRAFLERDFELLRLATVTCLGHRGILRLVNSPKLNHLVSSIIGESRFTRLKETLGFGWTLLALARKHDIA